MPKSSKYVHHMAFITLSPANQSALANLLKASTEEVDPNGLTRPLQEKLRHSRVWTVNREASKLQG
eukprot:5618201-Amphidinium_carterae.1